jgi:hypothetical protein
MYRGGKGKVVAPVVDGPDYMGPSPGTPTEEEKRPAEANRKDKAKAEATPAAKAEPEGKPIGEKLAPFFPGPRPFITPAVKAPEQRPLFGEHDIIVNALELEEKDIKIEIKATEKRITRSEKDLQALEDRLALVHAASVRARSLGKEAEAAIAKAREKKAARKTKAKPEPDLRPIEDRIKGADGTPSDRPEPVK